MEFASAIVPFALEPESSDLLWIVIVGFIIAFILAFAVGANDVANSYATSVGSGVLTLRQAYILAAITETAGAILLGYKVSDTIRKGIIDISVYQDAEKELMLGGLSTLAGSAIWLFVATWLKMPVSATHSTVAATVGYSLAARGLEGVQWYGLLEIVISWFISPVLSGIISTVLFLLIYFCIFKRWDPLKAGLIGLPIIYFLTIFVNVFSIVNDGPELLLLDNIPLWIALVSAICVGLLVGVLAQIFAVPYIRKKILSERVEKTPPQVISTVATGQNFKSTTDLVDSEQPSTKAEANRVFSFLQILSALFGSFAHGGNDVSNAIGPLIAIWLTWKEGVIETKSQTPIFILAFGGVGISVGLWVLGKRVIETIGKRITKMTAPVGFTIEMGSATTVLVASYIGIPISTTHCQIGSVVFVGYAGGWTGQTLEVPQVAEVVNEDGSLEEGKKPSAAKAVNWMLFGKIFLSWIATLPFAMGCSALVMWILRMTAL